MLILTALIFATPAESAPVQWPIGAGGNGHFYDVVLTAPVTWSAANAGALALPGSWQLVSITSLAESNFVESLLNPVSFTECVPGTLAGTICTGVWIGATASSVGSNDWHWTSGESFSFTDWGPFEPFSNGDRIRLDHFQTQGYFAWNDALNLTNPARGYVVESIPEPAAAILLVTGLSVTALRRRRASAQTPSLPGPDPRSDHPRCRARESNFLAPVLAVLAMMSVTGCNLMTGNTRMQNQYDIERREKLVNQLSGLRVGMNAEQVTAVVGIPIFVPEVTSAESFRYTRKFGRGPRNDVQGPLEGATLEFVRGKLVNWDPRYPEKVREERERVNKLPRF